jgi:hypothetical protein
MTEGAQQGPRLFHPLSGSNAATLFQVLTQNGPLPVNRYPHAIIAALATLARFPFYSFEKLRVQRLLKKAPPMKDPIFIVGHWRGGTTHLYNIMSKSGQFGFVPPLATGLPWDLLGIAEIFKPWLEKALPEKRFIDNVPVTPESPQEDEIALANMTPISFYHGLYFPKKFRENFYRGIFFDGCSTEDINGWKRIFTYFIAKMSLHQKGKQLLIKNPVYSARVAMLNEIYPNAKFIHIHRNPYMVFPSMRNFYVKLFKELALQPHDHIAIEDFVLETYPKIMSKLLEETADLPPSQFVELRYEDLEQDPLPQIKRIYSQLEIEGFEEALPRLEAYLKTVSDYKKNKFDVPQETTSRIETQWSDFIKRWDYARPT